MNPNYLNADNLALLKRWKRDGVITCDEYDAMIGKHNEYLAEAKRSRERNEAAVAAKQADKEFTRILVDELDKRGYNTSRMRMANGIQ